MDGNIFDEWGVGSKKIGEYTTVTSHPLPDRRLPRLQNTLADHCRSGPHRGVGGAGAALARKHRLLHHHTAPFRRDPRTLPVPARTEELFTDLHLYPKFAEALIEKIAEVVAELYVYFVTPVAPYITWVEFATDFGSSMARLVSPALYRSFSSNRWRGSSRP